MADFSQTGTVSITCPKGLLPFLKQEVSELGYQPGKSRSTGLELNASLNDTIKLNFWLRTAHRIHFLVDQSRKINSPEDLYAWLSSLPWEDYIDKNGYVSVTSRIDHHSIDNTQFANLKVKDAVVDRIRQKTGQRPDSGPDLDKSVVFLYWNRKTARIFIDTSGESLSRRGYRTESSSAPMQESLASAIVMASRWEQGKHFINPMCGSGTIALEALLMALNRPPASLRHDFGFMHILGYNEDLYNQVRNEARQNTRKETGSRFIATDNDPKAIAAAKKNARTAGVDHLIDFEVCDYSETEIPDGDGVVVINPPYGERMDNPDKLEPLYSGIGDFFKNSCPGKTGYVFTGNLELAKHIGLRTNRRITMYNSTIECRLLEFEIFKGSKY